MDVGPYASNIVVPASAADANGARRERGAIRYSGRWRRRTAVPASHARRLPRSPAGREPAHVLPSAGGRPASTAARGRRPERSRSASTEARSTTVDTYSACLETQQIWFDTGVLEAGPPHARAPVPRARRTCSPRAPRSASTSSRSSSSHRSAAAFAVPHPGIAVPVSSGRCPMCPHLPGGEAQRVRSPAHRPPLPTARARGACLCLGAAMLAVGRRGAAVQRRRPSGDAAGRRSRLRRWFAVGRFGRKDRPDARTSANTRPSTPCSIRERRGYLMFDVKGVVGPVSRRRRSRSRSSTASACRSVLRRVPSTSWSETDPQLDQRAVAGGRPRHVHARRRRACERRRDAGRLGQRPRELRVLEHRRLREGVEPRGRRVQGAQADRHGGRAAARSSRQHDLPALSGYRARGPDPEHDERQLVGDHADDVRVPVAPL